MNTNDKNTKPEQISMLKQSVSSGPNSVLQLRQQLKKKQGSILQAQQSITQRRLQIRKLSQNVSKIVEKELNRSTKDRPALFPGAGTNNNLSKLYKQRDDLHSQIAQVKVKILEQKSGVDAQLIQGTLKKREELGKLEASVKTMHHQNRYLKKDMDSNKKMLDHYDNSQVLRDIVKHETELQILKKKLKSQEKQYYSISNEEVYCTMFLFQLKDTIERIDKINNSPSTNEDRPVEYKQIQRELSEMQMALEERKRADRQHAQAFILKKFEIQKQIEINCALEKTIRDIANQSMRMGLQAKRYKSQHKHRNNSELDPQKSKLPIILNRKINQTERKQTHNIRKGKKKFNMSQTLQDQQQIQVTIGNWFKKDISQEGSMVQGVILDDQEIITKTQGSANIVQLRFIMSRADKRILGVQAIYQDVQGKQIEGQTLCKLDIPQQNTQIKNVKLQNITSLQYCQLSHENGVDSSNSNSAISFIKCNSKDPQYSILIGNDKFCQCSQTSLKCIDIDQKNIKGTKVLLFPYPLPLQSKLETQQHQIFPIVQYRLKSLKFSMCHKIIDEHIGIQSNQGDDLRTPERSYSVSDFNKIKSKEALLKKRVIVRGGTLKKLGQVPQVDFRLMANRKKLV